MRGASSRSNFLPVFRYKGLIFWSNGLFRFVNLEQISRRTSKAFKLNASEDIFIFLVFAFSKRIPSFVLVLLPTMRPANQRRVSYETFLEICFIRVLFTAWKLIEVTSFEFFKHNTKICATFWLYDD